MTVWDEVVNAINNFYGWLTGVGGTITDSYSMLGSWITQGMSSFGKWLYDGLNWIYSGLTWIGSKLVEAYQWLSRGLNWLAGQFGAGLTWVGQGLQNIGQWIWNGILWIGRSAIKALQDLWNWITKQLTNIWNFIVDLISGFVDSVNTWWTEFVGKLRDKLRNLIIVNLTIPSMWKAAEKFILEPSGKSFFGLLVSPFVGALSGDLIDAILPRPASTKIQLFPPITVPKWDYIPVEVELPPEPGLPPEYSPSPLPPVGYIPEWERKLGIGLRYDVSMLYSIFRTVKSGIGLKYLIEVLTPVYASATSSIGSREQIVYSGFGLAETVGGVSSRYSIELSTPSLVSKSLRIGSSKLYSPVTGSALAPISSVVETEVL